MQLDKRPAGFSQKYYDLEKHRPLSIEDGCPDKMMPVFAIHPSGLPVFLKPLAVCSRIIWLS